MYELETAQEFEDDNIRSCHLCNKYIEDKNYFITIYGLNPRYFHHKCYKCFFEMLFGHF